VACALGELLDPCVFGLCCVVGGQFLANLELFC
jgi:hypothetical protein